MSDHAPVVRGTANQRNIITHAVLVGLTPLIPLPFVDDLVKGYFQRRLVRSLAAAHDRQLSQEDIAVLTEDRGSGCLGGCLGQVFILPLKLIFRKIFFFLEWKRAVDLASHTYHQGYLLDYALGEGWLAAARPSVKATSVVEMRTAIDEVCRESPVKPVETAIKAAFSQSKSMLRAGAKVLEQAFRRVTGRPDEVQLAETVSAVETKETQVIEGVVSRLQKSIEAIPDEHFRNLRARLAARLKM